MMCNITQQKTPFVKGYDYENVARDPASKGNGLTCPWCEGSFPKEDFSPYTGKGRQSGACRSARKPPPEARPPGKLAPIVAKIIMKVFYAARVARFDLLRAIGFWRVTLPVGTSCVMSVYMPSCAT